MPLDWFLASLGEVVMRLPRGSSMTKHYGIDLGEKPRGAYTPGIFIDSVESRDLARNIRPILIIDGSPWYVQDRDHETALVHYGSRHKAGKMRFVTQKTRKFGFITDTFQSDRTKLSRDGFTLDDMYELVRQGREWSWEFIDKVIAYDNEMGNR